MSSGAPSFDEPRDKVKSRDPLVGTVLDDRFQIDDVLGSGGMSVVYLATQIRVNRQVAIKTLKMQLDSKQIYRERFHREITLLCALSHPHIVTVYDCVFDDEQQPYVVMDYLRGRSLEALIKEEGAVDLDRFARIVVQVCSALEYAHKNGVIHRDLKPGNLVLMDDEMDFVKVVDFGLAKLNLENRKLTQSGELWGSPPYLSPEQCIGKPEDGRSDIYSLGCVMYEMLTGKDPFHNGTTIYELIQYHVNTPPPSMRSINPLVNLPNELEAVIFKAMAKDPNDRYQTASELSNAIVKACAGGDSHESGNLKIMSGNNSSASSAPPPAVSVGFAANNFNLALDPMAGLNVEDAFLDRGARNAADSPSLDAPAENKAPPTRQLARDRFSSLDMESEPKKSGAGKMLIGGFVVVVICAIVLFAAVSMHTSKVESASNPNSAPTDSATTAGFSKTAATEPVKTASPDSAGASKQTTSKTSDQVDSSPPKEASKAPPPTAQKPTLVAPARVKQTVRIRSNPPLKRTSPVKPAGGSSGKKHDPWHELNGMRTN